MPTKNAAFRKIDIELSRRRWDGILVNTRFYPHSLYGMKLARDQGLVPVVLDHGSAPLCVGSAGIDAAIWRYEQGITRRGLKRYCPDYYGISAKSVEWLRAFGINPRGVITNAIAADAFAASASTRDFRRELALPKDAFVVAFTGRLVPEKGLAALSDAATLLASDPATDPTTGPPADTTSPAGDPLVHFLIAGEGPMRKDFKRREIANLHLLGRLDTPDVAALLAQSDAFCLPTRSEGFATSLLEAAACHTVPIVTEVGGVAELVPTAEFGIVLDEASGPCIADAIRTLRAAPERRACIANNIGELVRREFTWEKTADRVMEAFAAARQGARG